MEDIVGTAWLLGHDLKSPVSLIISAMEVLISVYENDEHMASAIPMLRGALAAANRQHNMVSDVLDLARLETNTYDLETGPRDIVALLKDSLDQESYSITTKKLKLVTELPDTPVMVNLDPELMRRVFSALVDNSIKFTVRDDVLTVRVRQVDDMVEVSFTDNGRLIFPEFESQIVLRPSQWEKRLDGSRTSVGMGLPFAYHVALAHGGSFTCKSDAAAVKTTFTLSLPAHHSKSKNG